MKILGLSMSIRAVVCTLSAAMLLGGCTDGDKFTYSGWRMADYFPFDGVRRWEFVSTDLSVPYKLVGDLQPVDVVDGVSLHTVSYTRRCLGNDPTCEDGSFVRAMTWRSDRSRGVFLHAADNGQGAVAFDPPVQVGLAEMKRNEVVTTETAGVTWTSEVVEVEPCPVQWNVDWPECLRLELRGGASSVSGDYWVINGFNIVAFDIEGEPARWELSKHEFSP